MNRELFEDNALSRYEIILNEFLNLAINRFTWKNLPLGLTSERLEFMLIKHGELMFFKSENEGYFILPCYQTSKLNIYGLPTKYQVNALNGKYNKEIDIDDGIIIKNNPLASEEYNNLCVYAKRIDDIERTQEINLFQQNIPKIIITDENSKLTSKNLIQKLKEFKLIIFAKKSLVSNINSSDVLDTSSPYLLDKLQQHKNELKCELLSSLGINNNNIVKKERLIVDEVNANNEYININIDLMLDLRKKACEEINKKFNFNIQVEKRRGEECGEVHNPFM